VRWRGVHSWAVSKDPDFVPKGRRRVEAYTQPEPSSTTLCLDELGPVCARSFVPAPGWSVDGHRIKAPLEYGRGLDKTWVYGALCVRDGQALTLSAPSRNTAGYLQLLQAIERAYPDGKLTLIGDNLSSHKSRPIQAWLVQHPRVQQLFILSQGRVAQPDGTLVAAVALRERLPDSLLSTPRKLTVQRSTPPGG
jgi:hypothetical protein